VYTLITKGKQRGDSPRKIAEQIYEHRVSHENNSECLRSYCESVNEDSFSTIIQGEALYYVMEEEVAQRWIDYFIRKFEVTTTTTTTMDAFEFDDNFLDSE
jgi:hypothetical protein